jgi:hypothetical protein
VGRREATTGQGGLMSTVIPVAALGLGWIGVVIVVLVVIWLLTRVF